MQINAEASSRLLDRAYNSGEADGSVSGSI